MKAFILFLLFIPVLIYAQEGFGFGEPDAFGFASPHGFSVRISGEAGAEFTGFFDDFGSAERIRETQAGDVFFGSLDFNAAGSTAEGVIRLNLALVFDGSSPIEIDEAFVRAFFGPAAITGGLRKLTWGKADSFGPLDVINPIDYSDLSKLSDPQNIKIGRPMIHVDWSLSSFSRLEAVFIPWFQGDKFARSGRWAPSQVKALLDAGINIDGFYPETNTLEYAQAGLRFTTSLGSSDLGFQYYFGRSPRPIVSFPSASSPLPAIHYDYFQQIGADFARVISGFNIRAEAGLNITGDLDEYEVVWSLGFDRDLFHRINLNLQGTGRERGSTRITGIISRSFLRDELELKATCIWGIEDRDFLFKPAIGWSRNDVSVELSAGFFGGDREGELGQYRDNSFLRVGLLYRF